MKKRVLVTRPEPGASKTADRLRAIGFEPVNLPLSKTVALEPAVPGDERLDAVAVSSANALRHASAALVARLADLPCHAVGSTTAAAARAAGFTTVIDAEGDASALAKQLGERYARGVRIAYLCGRVRMPVLEQSLAAAGLAATAIETYDTEKVSYLTDTLRRTLGTEKLDAALVYSVTGAEALSVLTRQPDFSELFANTSYYCLSSRIADALSGCGSGRKAVADEPTEAALFDLVRRTL